MRTRNSRPRSSCAKPVPVICRRAPSGFFRVRTPPLRLPPGRAIDSVPTAKSTEGFFYTQGAGEVMQDRPARRSACNRDVSEKLFRFASDRAHRKAAARATARRDLRRQGQRGVRAFACFREILRRRGFGITRISGWPIRPNVDAPQLWNGPGTVGVRRSGEPENCFGYILIRSRGGIIGGLGLAPSGGYRVDHAVFHVLATGPRPRPSRSKAGQIRFP